MAALLSVCRRVGRAPVWQRCVSPRGATALFVAALAVYGVQSIAWPLSAGRDSGTYLTYWAELFRSHPVYPELMLLRTPVAPVVLGPLFQLGGSAAAEVGLGLCFGIFVVATTAAAAAIDRRLALPTAAFLLANPADGVLFHQVSSDSICALGIALLLYATVRSARAPTTRGFALLGLLTAIVVLIRPVNEILVAFAVLPFLLPGRGRARTSQAVAFMAAAAVVLVGWAASNDVRYGDFTVARTGNAQIPLNRAFRVDRIVSPSNGPASRQLGEAVRKDLLTKQPYKAYGITEAEFFSSGDPRLYYDLLVLSDEVWGWSSNYAKLRQVGVEAVRAHLRAYLRGVMRTLDFELSSPYVMATPRATAATTAAPSAPAPTIVVRGRRLPAPSEGDLIPAERLFWAYSTPDHRIWTDWSDVTHPTLRFRYPSDRAQAASLNREVLPWEAELPNRNGDAWLSAQLNSLTSRLPPLYLWLLLGLPALLWWRRSEVRAAVAVATLSLAVIVATALGEPTTLEFALPFAGVFTVVGLAGIGAACSRVAAVARRRAAASRRGVPVL